MRTLFVAFTFGTLAVAAPIPPELRKPRYQGAWRIDFTNGVSETCTIERSGKAELKEPLRKAKGQLEENERGVSIIMFDDDRIERWTPVGKRYIVEHWFPGSQYPKAPPVLGIAELGR